MASWKGPPGDEGAELEKCTVCLCNVSKKKLNKHVRDCYEAKKSEMESLGVIKCPFDSNHILPISFLNHHLEGNCQEVQNLLRKFYQKKERFGNFIEAPPDYDAKIPEKYLSPQNRDLLYLLNEDLYGEFMREYERNNQQDSEQDRGHNNGDDSPE